MTILRVRTEIQQAAGGPGLSTMWFLGDDQSEANAAAAAVHDFWDTIKGKISTGTSFLVEPEVTLVNEDTGKPTGVRFIEEAVVAGTASGDVLPFSTQGLVSWRTGVFLNGRELRGRTYVPTPVEADNVGGFPLTAYSTALKNAGDTLLGTSTLVAYSVVNRVYSTIISCSAWNNWAELRTRRDN